MEQQQAPESVIRRIQLLFNLANQKIHDATNEAEAAAAMSKAQELLARYNLDLQMVQGAQVEGGTAIREEKREEKQSQRTAMYQWQQDLCKAIAEANFCWYWVQEVYDRFQISGGAIREHKRERKVKRHTILGRQGNVTVVQMMYEYLVDTIEKIIPFQGAERLSRSANSWRIGCAERLIERINERAERMKQEGLKTQEEGAAAVSTTAIVVKDFYEKEYAANYDARYGEGAYAKSKQQEAEWEARYEKRRAEAAEAERLRLAAETPEERKKREEKERKQAEKDRKASERYWKAQDHKEERERSRRDWTAYNQGRSKGSDIGLDSQLSHNSKKGDLK